MAVTVRDRRHEVALRILFLEPFAGGSHAAFADTLTCGIDAAWTRIEWPARHWKWRMRGAALELAERLGAAPSATDFDLVFATSMFPLAELGGLVPRLASVPKILFFHENQLAYPAQQGAEPRDDRDQHYAFTQLAAAAAADLCVFNSEYNRTSFLAGIEELVRRMPDHRLLATCARIARQSVVLPLPLPLAELLPPGRAPVGDPTSSAERAAGPLILWNHRWEHDKAPEVFFDALSRLADSDVPFRVAVCGQRFAASPPVFEHARQRLGARVQHFGFSAERADYVRLLGQAQLAVSTARQEFFGIAMLEAVHAGACPLVPDRLAYPELWPGQYRYVDGESPGAALTVRLAELCTAWTAGRLDLRCDRRALTERYDAVRVLPRYRECFESVVARAEL